MKCPKCEESLDTLKNGSFRCYDCDITINSSSKRKRKEEEESAESSEDEKPKTKKSKGKKQKKTDDDGPKIKRPCSAYMFFTKDWRSKARENHPDENVAEITKRLADTWGQISTEKKKKYEELAQKDRDRYYKEKEATGLGGKKKPAQKKKSESKKSDDIVI